MSLSSIRWRRWLFIRPVFFCWRRDDAGDMAGRIFDRLLLQCGSRRLIRDLESIPLGADFRIYIRGAIPCCKAVVVIIGPNWLQALAEGATKTTAHDDYVRLELTTALATGVRVIPVLVSGARMPRESELPTELKALAHLQALEVRSGLDFRNDMDRLIKQL